MNELACGYNTISYYCCEMKNCSRDNSSGLSPPNQAKDTTPLKSSGEAASHVDYSLDSAEPVPASERLSNLRYAILALASVLGAAV